MDSESEMMSDLAAADAAGDTELAQHIAGKIKAGRAQPTEQPGVLRRALAWAATPSKAMQPIIDENRRNDAGHSGPLGLTKDSGDVMAGVQSLVSGIPGYQREAQSDEARGRMAKFGSQHPVLGTVLPLVGGLSKPAMLPVSRPSPTSVLPQAIGSAGSPPEVTTIAGLPFRKVAGAAPQRIAQGAPEAAPAVAAAVNPFEAAGRAQKVAELTKAIDANAASHLGVNPQDPRFAEALGTLPEQWWDGMGQVAKINKPSKTTIGDVLSFYKDRAAQGARPPAAAPAAPPPMPQPAPPPAAMPPTTESVLPQTLQAQLRSGAASLGGREKTPLSMIDLLVGAGTFSHLGPTKAAGLAIASRVLRNYGPDALAAFMRGGATALDKTPPQVLNSTLQLLESGSRQ